MTSELQDSCRLVLGVKQGEVDWGQLPESTIHSVKGRGLDPIADGKAVKD